MFHNNLIKTDKPATLAFFNELKKTLPVEIVWKKGRSETRCDIADSATITCNGQKIFDLLPRMGILRAELAGDDATSIIAAARKTQLVKDPQTGFVGAQVIAYVILIGLLMMARPDVSLLVGGCAVLAFVGVLAYSLGVSAGCSRRTRLALTILLFICVLPTAPSSMLLVFAAGSLNRRAFHRRIYGADAVAEAG